MQRRLSPRTLARHASLNRLRALDRERDELLAQFPMLRMRRERARTRPYSPTILRSAGLSKGTH